MKLLQEVTQSVWKQIGKELATKATVALLIETARAKLYVWKEIELKKQRRDLDVVYRDEDLAWETKHGVAHGVPQFNMEAQTEGERQQTEHRPPGQDHDKPVQDV